MVASRFGKECQVKRTALLLLAIPNLVLFTRTTAFAVGDGVIQGRIVNGTADGGSTQELEVVWLVFHGDEEGEEPTTTTDAQGQFRFENLEVAGDWAYLVRVPYNGVVYWEGMLSFEAGLSELETEVAVYEATTDAKDLVVERAHIFVAIEGSGLLVTELYVFANSADRTFIGAEAIDGRRWTSRFLLPQESQNVSFEDGTLGGRFWVIEGGFVDTEPHWPGTTSGMFSYELDCSTGDCSFGRDVSHPISNLNVMVPDTGAILESNLLAFEGVQQAQGDAFLNYVGSSLMPGQELDLHVRLPGVVSAPTAPQHGSAQGLPWIILGIVLTALVLIYPFWRRRIETAARKGR